MKVVGYVFDADHWCESCTIDYIARAYRIPNNDVDLEDDYTDSEGNPIHPLFDDEETDYPVHCNACHEYLDTCWTSEGVDYVVEALLEYAREYWTKRKPLERASKGALVSVGALNKDVVDQWASELSYAVPSQYGEKVLSFFERVRDREKANES